MADLRVVARRANGVLDRGLELLQEQCSDQEQLASSPPGGKRVCYISCGTGMFELNVRVIGSCSGLRKQQQYRRTMPALATACYVLGSNCLAAAPSTQLASSLLARLLNNLFNGIAVQAPRSLLHHPA